MGLLFACELYFQNKKCLHFVFFLQNDSTEGSKGSKRIGISIVVHRCQF